MPWAWKVSRMAVFNSWRAAFWSEGAGERIKTLMVKSRGTVAEGLEKISAAPVPGSPGNCFEDLMDETGHQAHIRVVAHPYLEGDAHRTQPVMGQLTILLPRSSELGMMTTARSMFQR